MLIRMLTLAIVESALETVPKEISNHPDVLREARIKKKRPTELILDSGKHYRAMKRLRDPEKRGRPDIVHFCLLLSLDSPVNKRGALRVIIHTLDDKIIYVNPKLRLPRTYGRFCGLMEKLFKEEEIKADGEPLLRIEEGDTRKLLDRMGGKKIVFSPEGEKIDLGKLSPLFKKEKDIGVLIGGFSHGKFSEEFNQCINSFKIPKFSLGDEEFAAWTVVSLVLSSYQLFAKN